MRLNQTRAHVHTHTKTHMQVQPDAQKKKPYIYTNTHTHEPSLEYRRTQVAKNKTYLDTGRGIRVFTHLIHTHYSDGSMPCRFLPNLYLLMVCVC